MSKHGSKSRPAPLGDWRQFLLRMSALGVVLVLGLSAYLLFRGEQILEEQLKARGQAVVEGLTLARRWNADHGGLYVAAGADTPANPYLHLPDLTTQDGQTLRPVHPAEMTRQLSELAQDQRLFTFHLFSDRPLNPRNAAEPVELEAMALFRQGRSDFSRYEEQGERLVFRYVAPLRLEAACLPCHQAQGYKEGDIRGGVSVRLAVDQALRAARWQRLWVSGLALVVAASFLALVNFLVGRLGRSVAQAQGQLEEMAMRDELTGLYNRRYFYRRLGEEMDRAQRHGRPLTLVMIDIDHFKQVNDTYGHLAGDRVLRQLGKMMVKGCRAHDTVGRYGGEEIALILPETGPEGGLALAEKLRAGAAERDFRIGQDRTLRLTISLGVASLTPEDLAQFPAESQAQPQGLASPDPLIRRADRALYQAKQAGRNRVALDRDQAA